MGLTHGVLLLDSLCRSILLPMILIGVCGRAALPADDAGGRHIRRKRRQIGAPLSPTRCRRYVMCASGRLPAVSTCSYRAGRFHREPDGLLLPHHGIDGASTVIVLTIAAASGGRSGLTSRNRQTDLCVAGSVQL